MIIKKQNAILDIDLDATKKYSATHNLCDCADDRNFYVQSREKFPKLTEFLEELGLLIDRPDEIGSVTYNNEVEYLFISYTVVGKILEFDKYEIDMFDGDLFLNIVIDNWYVPNEQTTDEYFTVTVYNVTLPWVLDEPFPDDETPTKSFIQKLKDFFKKSR